VIKSVELITVSKNVAEALDKVKEDHVNNFERIVEYHMDKFPEWSYELTPLNSLSLDSMIRALYIGYEIEKTPEEKVKELYGSYHVGAMSGERYDEGAQDAIERMLEIIGMKVEGINIDN
jgi:hypothetical protein